MLLQEEQFAWEMLQIALSLLINDKANLLSHNIKNMGEDRIGNAVFTFLKIDLKICIYSSEIREQTMRLENSS